MVIKYDTSTLPGTKESGMGGIVVLGLLAVAAWATYKFWWVPRQEKLKTAKA